MPLSWVPLPEDDPIFGGPWVSLERDPAIAKRVDPQPLLGKPEDVVDSEDDDPVR